MADISYGSTSRDILFHILRYSGKEISRLSNILLCNVQGTHPLTWQQRILTKVTVPCCQWDYRDFVQVLVLCLEQVLASRQINFEGLKSASEAILRQNIPDHAISQPCLTFPPNSSEILEKVWQSLKTAKWYTHWFGLQKWNSNYHWKRPHPNLPKFAQNISLSGGPNHSPNAAKQHTHYLGVYDCNHNWHGKWWPLRICSASHQTSVMMFLWLA